MLTILSKLLAKIGIKIPATTSAETKLIRTLEGQLVVLANGLLVLAPIVSSTSPATSIKYGVILNSVTVGARSLLKAVLVWAPKLGLPAPASESAGEAAAIAESEKIAKTVVPQAVTDLGGANLNTVIHQAETDVQAWTQPPRPESARKPDGLASPAAPPPTIATTTAPAGGTVINPDPKQTGGPSA